MVLEQVLTIISLLGVGAAVVIYAARPRHRGVSLSVGAASLDSFSPVEASHSVPLPKAAAVATPVVETIPKQAVAPAEVAPAASVAAVGHVGVAPAATSVADPSPAVPASAAESVEHPPHAATGPRRVQRKKSTSTKSRTRASRAKKPHAGSE